MLYKGRLPHTLFPAYLPQGLCHKVLRSESCRNRLSFSRLPEKTHSLHHLHGIHSLSKRVQRRFLYIRRFLPSYMLLPASV